MLNLDGVFSGLFLQRTERGSCSHSTYIGLGLRRVLEMLEGDEEVCKHCS